MSEPTFDAQGNLHLGPYADTRKARLTVDFSPDESDGVALDVKEASGSASARAVLKLGDWTVGQDPSKDGSAILGWKDADGVVTVPTAYLNYLDAKATTTLYHQRKDTSLASLTAVPTGGSATQASVNALANALKAAFATHAASVGTRSVQGYHLAADAGNAATLAAVADASNLATSITLINALLVAINAHNNQAGVHFHDDATVVSITTDPPVTLAQAATDINDLLTAWTTHFTNGAA